MRQRVKLKSCSCLLRNKKGKPCQTIERGVSAGVQKETCCGYKRRQRFRGTEMGCNSLSGSRLKDSGRACWRGRGESVTSLRPAATRAGTRKPVAAARPPSPTNGATTPILLENPRVSGPTHLARNRMRNPSLLLNSRVVSFCTRPDTSNCEVFK